MKYMLTRHAALPVLVAAMVVGPSLGALAADYEVQMLNRDSEGRAMQFEPAFLKIQPGDTVTFIVTDRGHNSEIIPEMLPEGAEGWKGRINEEISVTFDVEGFYGYKCQPHLGMGMVGLIQVGDNAGEPDAEAAAKLPGRAKTRMAELIEAAAEPAAE